MLQQPFEEDGVFIPAQAAFNGGVERLNHIIAPVTLQGQQELRQRATGASFRIPAFCTEYSELMVFTIPHIIGATI